MTPTVRFSSVVFLLGVVATLLVVYAVTRFQETSTLTWWYLNPGVLVSFVFAINYIRKYKVVSKQTTPAQAKI